MEKSFKKDETISFSGDACKGIFIVRSGSIKISSMAASGKEQILDVFQNGQTCACHSGTSQWGCPGDVQAATDCQIWFLSQKNFEALIKSQPQILKKLSHILACRLCQFSDLIKNISLDSARSRLAKFIFDLAEKQEKHPCQPVLTHDEIAQRVNLTRETVTRYLNKFKRLKIIEVESHCIKVLNHPKLEQLCL